MTEHMSRVTARHKIQTRGGQLLLLLLHASNSELLKNGLEGVGLFFVGLDLHLEALSHV